MRSRVNLAGKVRIFELAKEVGLTSKELTALFNDRLGGVFEAKNQLSVVPDQIADLVRAVLLKPTEKPPAKPAATEAPAPAPPAKPQPKAAPPPPVVRLRPVTGTSPRTAAPPAPARAPEPAAAQPPATQPVPRRQRTGTGGDSSGPINSSAPTRARGSTLCGSAASPSADDRNLRVTWASQRPAGSSRRRAAAGRSHARPGRQSFPAGARCRPRESYRRQDVQAGTDRSAR